MPDFIELFRRLVPIQSEARSSFTIPEPSLAEDTIPHRLAEGIPLLSFNDLRLDWAQVANLVQKVILLLTKDSSDLIKEAQGLSNIACNVSHLEGVVRAWYEGSSLSVIAAEYHVDGGLLALVIGTALRPFLSAYSEMLLPLVSQESWRRKYCPICGGKPDFAFLAKQNGARWLVCSRCDAQWLFQRLECPYCGNRNQSSLAYFTDDEGRYRLYVCEECRSYIKAIDLRRTESEVSLPMERILTLDMDRQARDAGYDSGI